MISRSREKQWKNNHDIRERQRYQEVHAGQLNCGDVIETFLVEKRKEILQEKIPFKPYMV